jgi:SAM-dependent methyltransferase
MTESPALSATRAAYDAVAADFALEVGGGVADRLTDRALLGAFAEFVQAAGNGPVADLGCGPGHMTAYLRDLGLNPFGIDLSPQMVAQARRAHPDLRFDQGTMTNLDLPDGAVTGIVAMFSIINIPPDLRPVTFREFHRTLAPGGYLLIAFQVRDEPRHLTEWFGHEISLDAYPLPPDEIADLLGEAGLTVQARMIREPSGTMEKLQRAYLLARK